jgi:hypothetical protein
MSGAAVSARAWSPVDAAASLKSVPRKEPSMNTSKPFRSFDLDSIDVDPSFVGHTLARLRREQNIKPEQQAQALGIDLDRLMALSSSRMPRDPAEVSMVSARIGWKRVGWRNSWVLPSTCAATAQRNDRSIRASGMATPRTFGQ